MWNQIFEIMNHDLNAGIEQEKFIIVLLWFAYPNIILSIFTSNWRYNRWNGGGIFKNRY